MRLASDARFADVEVLARHQLTPELAVEVASADVVVFIDARVEGGAPGSLSLQPVVPQTRRSTVTHHLDPSGLAGLVQELYGRLPPMHVVSVRAASLGAGEELSPAAEAALPGIADEVARLLGKHAHA